MYCLILLVNVDSSCIMHNCSRAQRGVCTLFEFNTQGCDSQVCNFTNKNEQNFMSTVIYFHQYTVQFHIHALYSKEN